jgi:hypothetical protein
LVVFALNYDFPTGTIIDAKAYLKAHLIEYFQEMKPGDFTEIIKPKLEIR